MEAEREAHDPVCHQTIHPVRGYAHAQHQGVTYFFCDRVCREKFQRDPVKVLDADRTWEQQHETDAPDQRPFQVVDMEFLKARIHAVAPGFVELAATPDRLEADIWVRELSQIGIEVRTARRWPEGAFWRFPFLRGPWSAQVKEADEARGRNFLLARRLVG